MYQANRLKINQNSIPIHNPNFDQRSIPPPVVPTFDVKYAPNYNNQPGIYQNTNANEQGSYNYNNNNQPQNTNQYLQNSNQGMITDKTGYQGGNNIYNTNNNNNNNSYTNAQQIYYSNNVNQNVQGYQNQMNQNSNRFKIVSPQAALNFMIKGNYSNKKFSIAVPQELLTFSIKGNVSNNNFRNINPISNYLSPPMQNFSINPQKNIGIKMINSQNNEIGRAHV